VRVLNFDDCTSCRQRIENDSPYVAEFELGDATVATYQPFMSDVAARYPRAFTPPAGSCCTASTSWSRSSETTTAGRDTRLQVRAFESVG
jgi:hypothetical protein